MIILGIDPGSHVTGFGVVLAEDGRERLLDSGIIRVAGTPDHQLRLKRIYEGVCELIGLHRPDWCAIEMPIYGNNAQSMLKLGRAQAAAMMAALNHEIPVLEYTPKQVKKSVTGNGNASKEQVHYMIRSILHLADDFALTMDTTDALAVALCHAHRDEPTTGGGKKDWAAFIRNNPERLKG
ncbi:MAG: crossover junction endodeoxyribonuclease RuvC [Rhodothermales bacterium]